MNDKWFVLKWKSMDATKKIKPLGIKSLILRKISLSESKFYNKEYFYLIPHGNSMVPLIFFWIWYQLVDNLLYQIIKTSHLTISSSHWAILTSHVIVLFSHSVVPLFFSNIWWFYCHIRQHQHCIWSYFCHI